MLQNAEMPPVSAVIPCYNHGAYVEEAVESVRLQTHGKVDILVVDDGSTDPHTNAVLAKMELAGIRIIRKENGHLSSARNAGIEAAATEFVLILDADDRFEPDFVTKALRVFEEHPEAGAVTSWIQCFGVRKGIIRPEGGRLEQFLAKNNSCGNGLIRKSVWKSVGGYDEKMKQGFEDWEFWIRVTKAGFSIQVIPETLFFYRTADVSMATQTIDRSPEIWSYIISKHSDLYATNWKPVMVALAGQLRDKDMHIKKQEARMQEKRREWDAFLAKQYSSPVYWVRNFLARLTGRK